MRRVDINTAKSYLRRRLDVEIKGRERIKRLILGSFTLLIASGYPYKVPAEVFSLDGQCRDKADAVLDALRDALCLAILSYRKKARLLQEELNDSDAISVPETRTGEIREAVTRYTEHVRKEYETAIQVGLATGMTLPALKRYAADYAETPYGNPAWRVARELGAVEEIPAYGKGTARSALKSLTRLERFMTADAYREAQAFLWDGVTRGFVVYRGSSYPCQTCDDMTGFHPMDGALDMPPYHANCCCYAVPVYAEDILF
jgi:hypothetical protein